MKQRRRLFPPPPLSVPLTPRHRTHAPPVLHRHGRYVVPQQGAPHGRPPVDDQDAAVPLLLQGRPHQGVIFEALDGGGPPREGGAAAVVATGGEEGGGGGAWFGGLMVADDQTSSHHAHPSSVSLSPKHGRRDLDLGRGHHRVHRVGAVHVAQVGGGAPTNLGRGILVGGRAGSHCADEKGEGEAAGAGQEGKHSENARGSECSKKNKTFHSSPRLSLAETPRALVSRFTHTHIHTHIHTTPTHHGLQARPAPPGRRGQDREGHLRGDVR